MTIEPMDAEIEHYQNGLHHWLMREWDDCIKEFQCAVEVNRNFIRAYQKLGMALDVAGRRQDAIDMFRAAVRHHPDNASLHRELGKVLERVGSWDAAEFEYSVALSLNPNDSYVHYFIGRCLSHRGRRDEAKTYYLEALRIWPAHPEAKTALRIMEREEAIWEQPQAAEEHHKLGLDYQEVYRWEDAIDQHRKAIEIKPDYSEACNALGVSLAKLNKLDDAILYFHKCIEMNPTEWVPRHSLSLALWRKGLFQESIREDWEAFHQMPASYYGFLWSSLKRKFRMDGRSEDLEAMDALVLELSNLGMVAAAANVSADVEGLRRKSQQFDG